MDDVFAAIEEGTKLAHPEKAGVFAAEAETAAAAVGDVFDAMIRMTNAGTALRQAIARASDVVVAPNEETEKAEMLRAWRATLQLIDAATAVLDGRGIEAIRNAAKLTPP